MNNFFEFVNQSTGECVKGEKGTLDLKKAHDKAVEWFNSGNEVKVYYGGPLIETFLATTWDI